MQTDVVTYFCCGTETVNVNESELLAYLYTVCHFRDILLNKNTDMIPKYYCTQLWDDNRAHPVRTHLNHYMTSHHHGNLNHSHRCKSPAY